MKGLRKGVWTEEEDRKLLFYIKKHGEGGWRDLPHKAGLLRCGKSCRLRWANYLRPGIRRGEFSPEEEQIIIRLHAVLGNRWATIARHLYRRTDNEIKNHWNTRLKKRVANKNITTDQEYSIAMDDPNYSANNTPTKSPTNYESDHISDDQLSHDRPESTQVSAKPAEPNLQYCPNNNANFDNCSINLSHFDRPSHYGASSARLLNKIASKMGLRNLRHALVVGLDSSPSPTTDSSATSGGQIIEATFEGINYNASLVSEVRGSQFMSREMSMEFESPVEELLARQGSGCSYNSWREFDDIGSVDTDVDDQVFFPSFQNDNEVNGVL